MSFLYPWLWLGALAVAAPLWLHLRRRADPHIVRFSALKFLEDQPTPSVAPQRVQDIPLLLLRLLAVLLLTSAFTWPFFWTPETRSVSESRVYVLDSTMSQQAEGNFEKCKALLLSEIRNAGPQVQQALVELGSRARVLHQFSDNPAELIARVEALRPSAARGPVLEAVRSASALLEQSLGERRKILVYSDMQSNQWEESLNTAPFLDKVELEVRGFPGVTERPNLSLTDSSAQRVFRGDKAEADLLIRVARQGMIGPKATFTIRINGQVLEKREIMLSPTDAGMLQLRIPTPRGSWTLGEVRIDAAGDSLEADNVARFSLPPVREGRVSLLSQSPFLRVALSPEIMQGRWETRQVDLAKPDDEARLIESCDVLVVDSSYVPSLLVRDLIQRQLNNGRGVILLMNQPNTAAAAFLRNLDMELKEDEVIQADSPVGAGMGPLAPLPGPATSAPASPGAPGQPKQSQQQPAKHGFRYFSTTHPIFQPFLSPDFASLQGVALHKFAVIASPSALPLLFAGTGAPVMFEGTKTKGRLLVASFGFEKGFTDWMMQPSFIPFLDLCLQHTRATGPRQFSLTPGEVQVIAAESDTATAAVIKRIKTDAVAASPGLVSGPGPAQIPAGAGSPGSPDGLETEFIARYPLENGKANVRAPDMPGHYAVELEGNSSHKVSPSPTGQPGQPTRSPGATPAPGSGSATPSPERLAAGTQNATDYRQVIDVNPDPRESDLRYTQTPKVIQSWKIADTTTGAGAAATARGPNSAASDLPVVTEAALPAIWAQRIWWWLLAAAFTFLFVETCVLAWRTALRPAPVGSRPLFRR